MAVQVKLFTLAFQEEIQGFDTTEFDDFMKDRRVHNVYEHFFQKDDRYYWAILLGYEEPVDSIHGQKAAWTNAQRELWEMLKNWRLAKARSTKTAPFLIMHDKQLVEIIQKMPDNLTAMQNVRGIGEKKAQSFGNEILGVIAEWKKKQQLARENTAQKT